ncbi:MAG: lipid asymmetry maintenance protein MlaB [Bradymonadia bacterium]
MSQPAPRLQAPEAVCLGARLTIQEAEGLKARLLELLEATGPVTLEGDGIETVDTAGLQLLLAFAQDARGRQLDWSWRAPSDQLVAAARTLSLSTELYLD